MTLEQYVEEYRKELNEFFKYWEEHNKESPKDFPNKMDGGEWDEQFKAWLELRGIHE